MGARQAHSNAPRPAVYRNQNNRISSLVQKRLILDNISDEGGIAFLSVDNGCGDKAERISFAQNAGSRAVPANSEGRVADQGLGQNKLANPVFGHRQVTEDLLVISRGHKGLIERIGGLGGLLVEEFAAKAIVLAK